MGGSLVVPAHAPRRRNLGASLWGQVRAGVGSCQWRMGSASAMRRDVRGAARTGLHRQVDALASDAAPGIGFHLFPFCHVRGAAGLADHVHLVLAAFEFAREFVGGLAGEFVRIGVGLGVDIGDVADDAGR